MLKTLISLQLLLGGVGFLTTIPHAQAQIASAQDVRLIVLPFKNITQKPEDAWMSESFSENLTMALNQNKALRLIERNRIQAVLKEQAFTQSAFVDPDTAPKLGKLLGANKILLGNFQNIQGTLVVNSRIVDVATGQVDKELVAQLRGRSDDVLGLQENLSNTWLKRFSGTQNFKLPTRSEAAYAAFQQAVLLARTGTQNDLIQAIALLEDALGRDPNYGLAKTHLAELLALKARDETAAQKSADLERAIQLALEALKLDAPPGDVYRALAGAYAAKGEMDKAQAAIQNALKADPHNADTLVSYLSYSPMSAKELEAHFKNKNISLNNPWVQLALGTRYLEQLRNALQPDTASAYQLLSQARLALPEHPLIPLRLAEVYMLRGEFDQAREMAQRAIELAPDNFLIYYFAAMVMLYSPDQGQVQQWLEKSIQLNPQFGYSVMTLGYVHWRNDRLPTALDYFKQAEKVFPKSTSLEFVRAKFFFAQREFGKAKTHLQNALKTWGTDPSEHIDKGAIYNKLGDIAFNNNQVQEALTYYRQTAQTERHQQSVAQLKTALIWASVGQMEQSLQAFEKHLKTRGYQSAKALETEQKTQFLLNKLKDNPKNALVLNELGSLSLMGENKKMAEVFFQKALKNAPNNASIQYNYGLSLLEQKQWDSAALAFEKVKRSDPAHMNARYNLGLAFLEMNQPQKAKTEWQSLLKIQPDHAAAKAALKAMGEL